ncbi:hypothetical protein PUNSTDRAFT_61019 [Punctularia strigosozonata HHB-11173 SS5]|uniref:uncharacterized protein n=1 Tax=Punctularia strigosozonata (strain HHB-11173) TaxID=741275 RepID=UPI0004417516|nr:uncharacterized protein PUNSTDRAFT_61019 [Punctularia strigosozonata HHB-11173 SS5]EIN12649.1 hypothetical protein PUNSTDRAFT_61019 [Punctularia strigosozonata HHB-11173 SS5]
MSLPRDVQEFLAGYPGIEDHPSQHANLLFYRNQLRCRPDNLLVEEIHDQRVHFVHDLAWKGDYNLLEYKHGFIQWLFPIREYGMNYESQPLQLHERDAMKSDPDIKRRLLASYELMLDFYGMRLLDPDTGLLQRSLPPRNFEGQYRNLVRSMHNNLRISRILKCLSEMDLEHLNAGFLLHVLNEQSENGELNSGSIQSSMDRWWANCLRNENERAWIKRAIQKVRTDDNFQFTREKYEAALRSRSESGEFDERMLHSDLA